LYALGPTAVLLGYFWAVNFRVLGAFLRGFAAGCFLSSRAAAASSALTNSRCAAPLRCGRPVALRGDRRGITSSFDVTAYGTAAKLLRRLDTRVACRLSAECSAFALLGGLAAGATAAWRGPWLDRLRSIFGACPAPPSCKVHGGLHGLKATVRGVVKVYTHGRNCRLFRVLEHARCGHPACL
jgi:hypothetical protein